jgi:hypothetical protein
MHRGPDIFWTQRVHKDTERFRPARWSTECGRHGLGRRCVCHRKIEWMRIVEAAPNSMSGRMFTENDPRAVDGRALVAVKQARPREV